MRLDGKTKLAGVAGWPVSHSRSPLLHNFWLERLGVNGAYVPLPVPPDGLREAVLGLRAAGFRGLNITVPHKQAVIEFVDTFDDAATLTGAVNTLVFHEDGRIEGRNTDAGGFLRNLQAKAPAWNAGSGPAVVLGAGGAARAIVWALIDAGVPEIRIVARAPEKAAALAAAFNGKLIPLGWEQRAAALAGAALLVNTTTLGMEGQPPLEIRLDALGSAAVVADIVYAPLITPLLAAARQRGNCAVDGLGMLLEQARDGFAAWFGVMPAIDEAVRTHVMAGR